jgi:hypothetical protein
MGLLIGGVFFGGALIAAAIIQWRRRKRLAP